MWLLIFVCVYVCASVCGETPVFRKCCSRDHSLIHINVLEFGEHFECMDRRSIEMYYNISNAPLVIGDGISVESGMPESESCDKLRAVHLTTKMNSQLYDVLDQCYDKLILEYRNGSVKPNVSEVVALTCNQTETVILSKTNISIEYIRKCCPVGQSYDAVGHLCKNSDLESSDDWLVKSLNGSSDVIYAVDNGLHCKNEYGVELSEDLYLLELKGSSLSVIKKSGLVSKLSPQGEWCVDREFGKRGLVARVCTRDCGSYGAYCVRKCCSFGKHFKIRECGSITSYCVPNDENIHFDVSLYMDPLKQYGIGVLDVLGFRHGLKCADGRSMLNRSLESDYHNLTKDGLMESSLITNDDYCFESVDSRHCPGGDIYFTAFICFIRPQQSKNFNLSFVRTTISTVCLALTLIVYCCLPELRNLHGRTLICHISMMMFAFCCLARVYHSHVPNHEICTLLGYCIYFGFMAAFNWLNIICIDIWWTFRSMQSVQTLHKAQSDRRRFLWYSLYAWSVSVLMTLTMFLLDIYPVNRYLDVNIGNGTCWFGKSQNSSLDWPHYIFFVIPMGFQTCINFVLFILTARHCARVKSEVHRMQADIMGDCAKKRIRIDRTKYILSGKLWLVMGVGWILDFIITLIGPPDWIWSIVDLSTELQGVFTFLVLIFKPKLYYLIKKRLGCTRIPVNTTANLTP